MRRTGSPAAGAGLPLTRRAATGLTALVSVSTFVVTLSTTSLGVAVPAISRSFHGSSVASSLVVVAPLLVSTVLLLPMGRISDLLGRRASYLVALTVFTVANTAIGAAPRIWILIACQVVQAASVGAVWANSAAILLEALDQDRFRHALGIYIAAISLAELLGSTTGGVVTEALGWRWIFWGESIVGAACLAGGLLVLPRRRRQRERVRLDAPGFVLLVVGLGGITAGLLTLQTGHGAGPGVVIGCGVGVAALVALRHVERRQPRPLVDQALFVDRGFRSAIVSSALNAMAQWVPSLLLVLFFQAYGGDSPLVAGLTVMPLPIVAGLCSAALGRLARWRSTAWLSLAGSTAGAAGLLVLPWVLTAPYPALVVALMLLGVGSGVFSPAIADVMLEHGSEQDAGLVNGTRLTAQNVGWVCGTALSLGVVTTGLSGIARREFFAGRIRTLHGPAASHLLDGYHAALGVLALAAVVATLLTVGVVRRSVPAAR
jgi:MFS family permease